MKKSLLALAVTLAAASGANASWNVGSDFFEGNGELILTVFDTSTQSSYTQDLGVTFDQLRAGYTGSIALDSSYLSVFGGNYSNVQYNIMAVSNAQYDANTFAPTLTQAGAIYSMVAGQVPWETPQGNVYGQVGELVVNSGTYASAVGFDQNPAENPVFSVTNGALGYAGGSQWIGLNEGNFNRDLSGATGSTMELWLKTFAQDDGQGTPDFVDLLLGSATLNLAAGAGSISFASNAPEVPVPAAVWLLGSALVGLGGVARRRRIQA